MSALFEAAVRACLGEFGAARLTVRGACMEPRLPEGAVVRLAAAAGRPPRVGDAVIVRLPEGLRLHRLVWAPAHGRGWRTMADRARTTDPAVPREAVLATAVAVEGPDRRPLRPVRGLAARLLLRALGRRLRAA